MIKSIILIFTTFTVLAGAGDGGGMGNITKKSISFEDIQTSIGSVKLPVNKSKIVTKDYTSLLTKNLKVKNLPYHIKKEAVDEINEFHEFNQEEYNELLDSLKL